MFVVRIVVAHKLAIFDCKAIAPESDMTDRDILVCEILVKYSSENIKDAPRAFGSGTKELGTSSLPSVWPLPLKELVGSGRAARPLLFKSNEIGARTIAQSYILRRTTKQIPHHLAARNS